METLYHSQPFVFEGSVWNEWRSVISGEEVKVRNPKFAFVQSHPARNFMVEKGWGRDTMQQLTGLSEAIGLVPFARWPLGWHFGKWVDVWCVPEVPKMREGQLQLKQLHDFARIFAEVKTMVSGFHYPLHAVKTNKEPLFFQSNADFRSHRGIPILEVETCW